MSDIFTSSISIAICDDVPYDLKQTETMTKELLKEEGIGCSIQLYGEGDALLKDIENGAQFQIMLLDVMMDGLNGIELAAALRKQGDSTSIIFISANRDMALQGYEVSAVRYLAKPLQGDKLKEALIFCCKTQLKQKEILLPTSEGQSRIVVSELMYAEPWNRGTRLVLTGGQCETAVRISELEQLLQEEGNFVLSHRTVLVNLAFIQSIQYCELTLKNGQTLPVSKYRQAELKERFLHYLRG